MTHDNVREGGRKAPFLFAATAKPSVLCFPRSSGPTVSVSSGGRGCAPPAWRSRPGNGRPLCHSWTLGALRDDRAWRERGGLAGFIAHPRSAGRSDRPCTKRAPKQAGAWLQRGFFTKESLTAKRVGSKQRLPKRSVVIVTPGSCHLARASRTLKHTVG